MADFFDDLELDFECPNCGKTIYFKAKDVGNTVACPHCSESILLKDDGSFKKGVNEVNKSLKELDDVLKNFGK